MLARFDEEFVRNLKKIDEDIHKMIENMDGDITKDIRDASVLGKYLKSIGMRDTEAYAPRTLFLSVSNMRTGKKMRREAALIWMRCSWVKKM